MRSLIMCGSGRLWRERYGDGLQRHHAEQEPGGQRDGPQTVVNWQRSMPVGQKRRAWPHHGTEQRLGRHRGGRDQRQRYPPARKSRDAACPEPSRRCRPVDRCVRNRDARNGGKNAATSAGAATPSQIRIAAESQPDRAQRAGKVRIRRMGADQAAGARENTGVRAVRSAVDGSTDVPVPNARREPSKPVISAKTDEAHPLDVTQILSNPALRARLERRNAIEAEDHYAGPDDVRRVECFREKN